MKKLLLVVLLAAPSCAKAAYFDTIVSDPMHPRIAATALYTSNMAFDAASMDVALVWHKADPKDSILPQRWLDAGVRPVSWTLLEAGGGGDVHKNAFATVGWGVNVAPALLGPVAAALNDAGGKIAVFGSLLQSPDGDGIKLSLCWKASVIENGGFVSFDHLRFPPRYGIGYQYKF